MTSGNSAAPLAIHLFGPFDLQVNGETVLRLRSRKGQWLLALLALRAGPEVERSWLAGTLWPDSPEAAALANLRSSLKELRRALVPEAGRLLSPTPRTLCLDLAGAAVDALVFDAAVEQGDAASLERAVSLYQGPLLEGCAEEWVIQERAAREQAYLMVLERLADQALHAGEPAAAERYLRRAVAVDPLRETAQRALMRALAAAGSCAAATEVYRELRLRLHREVNAAPDAATTELYERLRAEARQRARVDSPGAPAPAAPPAGPITPLRPPDGAATAPLDPRPHNLPSPLTRFIGREREMAEIRQHLSTHRLVTLTGAGGCGKTRLALQMAAELLEAYSDGARFVELAQLADPTLVPRTVAAALAVPEAEGAEGAFWGPGPGDRPLTDTLVAALKHRELLLILDNCEHLIQACARFVESLLRACPRLRILATSREALEIGGELRYRVPSLSLPDLRRLPVRESLTQYESARLFVDRALMAQPAFALTDENAAAVAEVCSRLDGIPLAIELAAARVAVLPVEQIAARLHDRFRLLTSGSRTALPRQQTLRALIDWSYDLVAEPERILLRRLSVFAGGWDLEAAEAVCSDRKSEPAIHRDAQDVQDERNDLSPSVHPVHPAHPCEFASGGQITIPDADVLDLLARLVNKSLALYEEQCGAARYRLLETVRQYGQDRLREAGEAEAVRDRHRDFFLALAETAEPELVGPNQAAWFDRLEREHDNLRAALDWSQRAEGDLEKALRLAGALWWFWAVHNHGKEGLKRLEALLARSEAGQHGRARAKLLLGAANLTGWRGDRTLARRRYEEAQALFAELGEQQSAARCLNDRGLLAQYDGDMAAARSLQEQALTLQRELGNRQGIAWTVHFLGNLALADGDLERARCRYEDSLSRFEETGEKHGIATSLLPLGRIALEQGDPVRARALHERSLVVHRELGHQGQLAWSLLELGDTARLQGDAEAARTHYAESLAIGREMDHRTYIAASLLNLGRLALDQGDPDTARPFLHEALALLRQAGDDEGIALALEGFASLALALQQPERAARLLGAADAIWDRIHVARRAIEQADHDRVISLTRAALSEEARAAAWTEGRAMPLEQAIRSALEEGNYT